MASKTDKFIYYIKYFIVTTIFNIAFVPIHEMGHALIYILEGYKVSFHFTKADPTSGIQTLLGASGGILVNALFACIFLLLFYRYKNITFYAGVISNTLFTRIIMDILKLPKGIIPEDETFIANSLHSSPLLVAAVVMIVLTTIFILATTILIKSLKSKSKLVLALSFLACIIGLFVVTFLESAGL
jgi:hypothetical protein